MRNKMEEILRSLNSSTAYKFYKHIAKYNRHKSEKNILLIQVGNIVSTFADVSVLINDFDCKLNSNLSVRINHFIKWHESFYSNGIYKC